MSASVFGELFTDRGFTEEDVDEILEHPEMTPDPDPSEGADFGNQTDAAHESAAK